MRATLRTGVVCLIASVATPAQAPTPAIQNGRVIGAQATTVEAAIRAAPPAVEPIWLAWREPIVDGVRTVCSAWSDGDETVRGILLDPAPWDRVAGVAQIARALHAETNPVARQRLAGALRLSSEPAAADVLLQPARSDADARRCSRWRRRPRTARFAGKR
jgi:hypothetical protein